MTVSDEMLSLVLDEHRHYLADEPRMSAYKQAITEVVKPGDVVLDLGAGTGILGLLACHAGAVRVYAVESGPIIELARRVSSANDFVERLVHIKGLSTKVELPEHVDVVVADQVGFFGFDAGLLVYFKDAVERFLKPQGAIIPQRLDLYVAPVECNEMWEHIDFWKECPQGLSFLPFSQIATNICYPVTLGCDQLLGDPVTPLSLDLLVAGELPFSFDASIVAKRSGILHGIGGWSTAWLSPSVSMSNSPLATQRINRPNLFLPIEHAVIIDEGDVIQIQLRVIPKEMIISWKVGVSSGAQNFSRQEHVLSKGSFIHSTWKSLLVSHEALERTRPDFVPNLTPRGEVSRAILELCDGTRTLVQIEQEIWRRYTDVFHSASEAAAFVNTIVGRYSN